MSSLLSVNFLLKPAKANSKGEAPIYARILIYGKRSEFSLSTRIDVTKWNKNLGSANGTTENVRAVNFQIETVRNKLIQLYYQNQSTNKHLTSEDLKNLYLGIGIREKTILEVFAFHNENMKSKIGVQFADGTYDRYDTVFRLLKQFLELKYRKSDMPLRDIDFQFITELESFFLSTRKCSINTTAKYMSNFRKITNLCLNNDWITRNPFARYKVKKVVVPKPFLTMEEMARIKNAELGNERLEKVRDIFLLSCCTGLAYCDVKRLSNDNIILNMKGERILNYQRLKTGVGVEVPLHDLAISILDKYSLDPECQNKDVLMPVISNQKMNEYLKEIAIRCKIKVKVTYHLARHTFATNLLESGTPVETVQKLMGHKSIQQTLHYAKIQLSKIHRDMTQFNENLSAIISGPVSHHREAR